MSRGPDRDDFDREQEQMTERSQRPAPGRSSGSGSADPGRIPLPQRSSLGRGPGGRRRERFRAVDRTFQLSDAEWQVMRDLGRFRVIGEDDLLRFRYAGNGAKLGRDYLNLKSQGLVERTTASVGKTRKPLPVYALTRAGKKVLKQAALDSSDQSTYAGIVKPAEVAHDAAIYRMFQTESAAIEEKGGRVRRVVLDFELKKKIYSPLAKARDLGALAYAQRQAEIAAENGLVVVDGKIPLPDLRIEYETADGEQARVDLELTTENYHRAHLSDKSRAGFKMYGTVSTSRGSRAEWEGRELSAGILAL